MRKITKGERTGILFILIGILVFAFLTSPLTDWVTATFPSGITRFIIGIVLIVTVAYFGKLNKIFK